MSLLEDVFLQDEAGEAQELERVIEGDEYDERPRSAASNSDENSEKEDEAEEDKQRVDPTKAKATRVVKNPRVILNPARLTGPRGIQVIPDHFKDFKFKGKGHEKEDLDLVLKKLEHWAYRLFPKFEFGDCLKKIETLGKKRPVMVHLHKIRSDQYTTEETVVQRDSSDDERPEQPPEEDEFDKLLQQQIELARATPAPGSVTKRGFDTPSVDKRLLLSINADQYTTEETVVQRDSSDDEAPQQPPEEDEFDKLLQQQIELARATPAPGSVTKRGFDTPSVDKRSPFTMPKATSSPSISDEQRDRMLRNRQLAEERRLARLKQNTSAETTTSVDLTSKDIDKTNDVEVSAAKHNRSNVINSSDDEDSNNVNRNVIIDLQMHDTADKEVNSETIVDLTRTEAIGKNNVDVNASKHHRTKVIDSSDDEDSNGLNRDFTVDVQMHDIADKEVNNETTVDLTNTDVNKSKNVEVNAAKKHKSNVIDSSDDEDTNSANRNVVIDVQIHDVAEKEVNNETTVDLTNTDVNKSKNVEVNAAKKHKSNVIDSSDDEDTNSANRNVVIDVQMHDVAEKEVNNETTVDLTNTDVNKNKDVEVNAAKKHKSNVINSSEDEDSNAAKDATVDEEMHVTANLLAEINNKTAENSTNTNQNVTVDLTEGIPIKHSNVFKEGQVIDIGDDNSNNIRTEKYKENNVVDSSDEECEVTAFNHCVSVDVHSKNSESYTENNEKRTSIGKTGDSNSGNISCVHETEVVDEHFEEIPDGITEKDNRNEDIEVTTKEITETAKIGKQNENNTSETTNDIHNKLVSEISRHDKENVDSNVQNEACETIEELMDVDFSDDF